MGYCVLCFVMSNPLPSFPSSRLPFTLCIWLFLWLWRYLSSQLSYCPDDVDKVVNVNRCKRMQISIPLITKKSAWLVQVVLAANDMPTINDITYEELGQVISTVKRVTDGKETIYGVDSQHLMVVNSGSDLPVRVSVCNWIFSQLNSTCSVESLELIMVALRFWVTVKEFYVNCWDLTKLMGILSQLLPCMSSSQVPTQWMTNHCELSSTIMHTLVSNFLLHSCFLHCFIFSFPMNQLSLFVWSLSPNSQIFFSFDVLSSFYNIFYILYSIFTSNWDLCTWWSGRSAKPDDTWGSWLIELLQLNRFLICLTYLQSWHTLQKMLIWLYWKAW